MNIFYHEELEGFYNKFVSNTMFLSVLLSTVAFSGFAALAPWVAPVSTLMIAGLNAAVLAFGMGFKYNQHSALKSRWYDFLSQVELMEEDRPHWEFLTRRYYDLCAQEPKPQRKRLLRAQDAAEFQMGLLPRASDV
jgi:hypothetical protein